jgi:hypothetical protein
MGRMVGDAKFRAHHDRHAPARPDLPAEAIRFGATAQQLGQVCELCGSQATWGTGRWAVPESVRASSASALHPLADRPLADAQGVGDLALGPTSLFELPGLQPSGFFPIMR